jgi:hypothetical protein
MRRRHCSDGRCRKTAACGAARNRAVGHGVAAVDGRGGGGRRQDRGCRGFQAGAGGERGKRVRRVARGADGADGVGAAVQSGAGHDAARATEEAADGAGRGALGGHDSAGGGVVAATGFENPECLSAMFRRECGLSPREFRARHGGDRIYATRPRSVEKTDGPAVFPGSHRTRRERELLG